jgi:hypothetical protein
MMSAGIVVCSICYHEVHQNSGGWFHCDSNTPICNGAIPVYPRSTEDIQGKWCGRDDFSLDEETSAMGGGK